MPVSNCKAAVLVLVGPRYFISPVPSVSGEHSPYLPPREVPDGRLANGGRRLYNCYMGAGRCGSIGQPAK
jgi:hypothetical protein